MISNTRICMIPVQIDTSTDWHKWTLTSTKGVLNLQLNILYYSYFTRLGLLATLHFFKCLCNKCWKTVLRKWNEIQEINLVYQAWTIMQACPLAYCLGSSGQGIRCFRPPSLVSSWNHQSEYCLESESVGTATSMAWAHARLAMI